MRCVLLSGGGGTRLWPLSTPETPKQFMRLPGGGTLFEEAVLRNAPLSDSLMVIAGAGCRTLAWDALTRTNVSCQAQLVLEPCPRNTAPAIAMAALFAPSHEVLLVVPTDHRIDGKEEYAAAVSRAEDLAQSNSIVVFGVKPECPHTGYGYIQHDRNEVLSFTEKPNLTTAVRYLEQGDYLWNSGMLACKAGVLLDALKRHCPDILSACELVAKNVAWEGSVATLDSELFAKVRAESIDYAVLEHADRVRVTPAHFSWSDLGSLDAFGTLTNDDASGNRVLGKHAVVHKCARTSIYNSSSNMTVVANGLSDVIVTVTNGAVYVTRADCADEVRDVSTWIREAEREET